MNATMLVTLGAESSEGWINHVHHVMHIVAVVIGIAGVAVLVWGALLAVVKLASMERCRFTGGDLARHRYEVRRLLGFYLLLSLELLVAADIIETIIKPDLDALLVLGLIVLIRTVISFSLSYELRHEAHETQSSDDAAT